MADATVAAIPYYLGTMYFEQRSLKRTREGRGGIGPADYTRPDTVASISMGLGSLLAPFATKRIIKAIAPGKSKYGAWLVGAAAAATAVTTLADLAVRRARRVGRRGPTVRVAEQVQRVGGIAALATGGLALSTAAAIRTNPVAQWEAKGSTRDRGNGPGAWLLAMLGWDFIYYWNHRLQHEVRGLWAIHVVHHSSERYNLSTALRQPVVGDLMGVFVPYVAMSRAGIRPSLVASARSWNLLYQYWVHTETINRLGAAEEALSTPSHHRVHHGSNRKHLDRNQAASSSSGTGSSARSSTKPSALPTGLPRTSTRTTPCASPRANTPTSPATSQARTTGTTGCRLCCGGRAGPSPSKRKGQ